MTSVDQEKPCPSCTLVGKFETSRSGAEELVFCTECGFIDNESKANLVESAGFGEVGEYYSNDCQVKLDRRGVVSHGKSKSSMKKKQLILDAVGHLGLPNTIKTGALELFDRILPFTGTMKTPTLSLACLFIVVNRDGRMHIPLRDFCRRLQQDKFAIAKAKRWILVNKFHEADDPERILEALIAKRLHERGIPMTYERKLKKLMSLVKKGWVSAGRTDEMFLWPCLYVLNNSEVEGSWQAGEVNDEAAEDIKHEVNKSNFPKKLSRKAFFREHRIRENMSESTFSKNLSQVSAFLLTLTMRVPWLTAKKRGTEAGLFKSLDWILDNEGFCGEMIEKGNDTTAELKEFPPPVHMKIPNNPVPLPVEEVDPRSIPLGEELGEEDIKDEDLHLYIRSGKEVEMISEFLDSVAESH